MNKKFLTSKKDVERFIECGNHSGKDNVLFFGDNTNEVFLLLHGSTEGFVKYDNQAMTLQQVFQCLKQESIFELLELLKIKYINVLCCHGFYQQTYEENGIIIRPFFNNKGYLLGKKLSSTEFEFETKESLVA